MKAKPFSIFFLMSVSSCCTCTFAGSIWRNALTYDNAFVYSWKTAQDQEIQGFSTDAEEMSQASVTLQSGPYLYSSISNCQVIQAIAPLRLILFAVEVLQQQYPFPDVRRVFTSHKAPGILKLSFLCDQRWTHLLVIHVLEFLKHNHSKYISQDDAMFYVRNTYTCKIFPFRSVDTVSLRNSTLNQLDSISQ